MADLSGVTSSQISKGVATNGRARGTDGIIDKVRDTAAAQLTSQKKRATDGLGNISQAVRQSTHQLRDQEHDVIAHYVEQAADQIDRFSQHMRDKNVDDLMRDIQQMARRRPALFIGGAFAVGLIGARFLKSSSRNSTAGRGGSVSRGERSTATSALPDFEVDDTGLPAAATDVDTASVTHDRSSRASTTNPRRSAQSEAL
jgi:hypothetical protein